MKYLWALLVFVSGEIVAFFIFLALKKTMGPPRNSPAERLSVIKGMLERMTMVVGLLHDFPHVLIAFGALKIGTRLTDEKSQISNNYFLIGNLVSVFLAMVYAIITKGIWQ